LPALCHHHTFNTTVILHHLKQFPIQRLRQDTGHIVSLAMSHLNNGDPIIRQISRSFGK
jgi:hypothetical protein